MIRRRPPLGVAVLCSSVVATLAAAGGAVSSEGGRRPTVQIAETGRLLIAGEESRPGRTRVRVLEADITARQCRPVSGLGWRKGTAFYALSRDGRFLQYHVQVGRKSAGFVQHIASGRRWTVPAESALSPRGERIAYLAGSRVLVRQLRGGRPRIVAVLPGPGSELASFGVLWSPTGRWLSLIVGTGGGRDALLVYRLQVMRSDGRQRKTIYREPNPYSTQPYAVFSPDDEVVLITDGSEGLLTVQRRNLKTMVLRRNGTFGKWSPDGGRISFIAAGPTGRGEVWVMHADGSGQRPLTNTPAPVRDPNAGSGSVPLAWSPDGNAISYVRVEYGKYTLAVMNADGSEKRDICVLPPGFGAAASFTQGSAVWTR